MRPRAIQSVPGLDPKASPAQRFEQFSRMLVAVPKSELEKEIEKSGSAKRRTGLKRKVRDAS